MKRGLLLALVAPSGGGKTTIIRALRKSDPTLHYSVSATTRPKRRGERNGRDYLFLSRAEFDRRERAGEFVETATVHGCRYGTLRSAIEGALSRGRTVLFDVDVKGARALDEKFPEAVSVFLLPPSWTELRRRIKKRAVDGPEVVRTRLENARGEVAAVATFDYVVINDRLGDAVSTVRSIIVAERHRPERVSARLLGGRE
jgi:guanylate kinase